MATPQQQRSSRCVFVGNIPYDATEEELKDVFGEVGPVVSFRLVFDRETAKPKGFGFCEYRDPETALSAIRNLNNREVRGRTLRVDVADNEKGSADGIKWDQDQSPVTENIKSPLGNSPIQKSEATVESRIAKMSQTQLHEVLWSMKNLIKTNPDQAKQILKSNPQFAYAILHAQIILGLVDPNVVKQALLPVIPSQPSFPIAPPPAHATPNFPPQGNMYQPNNQFDNFPPNTQFKPQIPPNYGSYTEMNPNFAHQMPPNMYPPNNNQLSFEQNQILQQVLNLTPQDLERLDPDKRHLAQQLQQQLKQQQGHSMNWG